MIIFSPFFLIPVSSSSSAPCPPDPPSDYASHPSGLYVTRGAVKTRSQAEELCAADGARLAEVRTTQDFTDLFATIGDCKC